VQIDTENNYIIYPYIVPPLCSREQPFVTPPYFAVKVLLYIDMDL